jgi:hypothetical protein
MADRWKTKRRTSRSNDTDTPEIARMERRVRRVYGADAEEDRPPDDGDAKDASDGDTARLVAVAVGRNEEH